MRSVKLGFLLAAAMCIIGPSTAWACPVLGTVVCEGTNQPVEGVVLNFVEGTNSFLTPATDPSGDFTIDLWGGFWDVYLGTELLKNVEVWDIQGQPFTLWDPIEVPASLVPECGSQPGCVLPVDLEGRSYLTADGRPIGNPDAECAYFAPGSVPIGEGFNGTLEAPLASMNAAFAVVKSGRNFYAVTVDVQEGDALLVPDVKYAVSHATYCSCPTEEAAARAALSGANQTSGGCSTGAPGALALMGLAALLPRLRRRSR